MYRLFRHKLFTHKPFIHRPTCRLLGAAAGLSLVIGFGYLASNRAMPQATAQTPNQSPSSSVLNDSLPQFSQSNASGMTLAALESILETEGTDLQGSNGQWQITIEERTLLVLADASNNRMRIFTPVTSAESLSPQQIQSMLLANFHTALDARYALSEDVLVSVFIHPLSSLNEVDLRSALSQVATLANTFGDTYTSGVTGFGPSAPANSSSLDQLSI